MATTEQLQAELAQYKAAETQILTGAQRYGIGDRNMERPKLADVQSKIRELESRLAIARQKGVLTHSAAVFGGARR